MEQKKPRKKRLGVKPGKSVCEEDVVDLLVRPGTSGLSAKKGAPKKMKIAKKVPIEEEEYLADEPEEIEPRKKIMNRKTNKNRSRINESTSEDDSDYSIHNMSSDLNVSTSSESEVEIDPEKQKKCKGDSTSNLLNLKKDDFIVVSLKYDEGTKKESTKQFVAQILKDDGQHYEVKFMRKSSKAANIYFFPVQEDIYKVKKANVKCSITPLFVRRGRYCFPLEM